MGVTSFSFWVSRARPKEALTPGRRAWVYPKDVSLEPGNLAKRIGQTKSKDTGVVDLGLDEGSSVKVTVK